MEEGVEFGEGLADASVRGRPLGDKEFFTELEKRAGEIARDASRPKQITCKHKAQMELEIGI